MSNWVESLIFRGLKRRKLVDFSQSDKRGIRGFMDCLRSEELKERLPKQFSENDLAGSIVTLVRNLPNSLIEKINESFHNIELSANVIPN